MRTKELVKFGPKPAFLHPYHLSGREMAQIQPPTLTLDPTLIIFYAEGLHLCIETLGDLRCAVQEKGMNSSFFWWAMAILTACRAFPLLNTCGTLKQECKRHVGAMTDKVKDLNTVKVIDSR